MDDKQKYWDFLESLRRTGTVNMVLAGEYLMKYFPLDKRESREILHEWLKARM